MSFKNEVAVSSVTELHQSTTVSSKAKSQPFVPFGSEPVEELKQDKIAYGIPWLGLATLFISILTIISSWLILHFIDGHVVFTNKFLKPASWLSAILSANSVCLHIALVEGFNIAWWYRATRADACVADLHTIWLHGTSSFSALKSGRSFNYIALATLFVATVPLNGFILQNAISVDSTLVDSKVNMTYTTRTSLPLGWSGSTSNQSSVVTVPLPSLALSQIVGNSFSGIQSADFSTGGSGCASGAICSALMPSVGFWAECNSSSLPYDLPNDSSSNITTNATLFTSAITWTNSNPNDVDIRVQWKPVNEDATGPCKGTYKVKECKLRAASLLQPVQVTSFIPQTNLGPAFPHFTLNLDSSYTYTSDKLDEILPILPNEGITNSTYGGIASIMEKFLTGSVNISYLEGKPSIISEGLYSNVVGIASNSMNTPDPGPMSTCNITAGSSSSIDIGDQIINAIRQLVWTSVTNDALSSAMTSGNPQHTLFQGTQSNPENHYKIIWIYWIGSLIITLSIVLAVTPIFWGFWALGRKTTMSPFETARAFHAPGISDAPLSTETPVLLAEIGPQRVHDVVERA